MSRKVLIANDKIYFSLDIILEYKRFETPRKAEKVADEKTREKAPTADLSQRRFFEFCESISERKIVVYYYLITY